MVSVTGELVVHLDEVGRLGRTELGSKAATLAILKNEGFPVAPGLCVRASAYREFVKAGHLETFIELTGLWIEEGLHMEKEDEDEIRILGDNEVT